MSDPDHPEQPNRRRALRIGAAGAVAVVSIRPAMAQAYGSVLTCEIPVPDPGRAGGYIDQAGKVVPSGTKGAYAPPARPLKGEDVRRALASGGNLPGVDYDRSRAYLKYVQNLRSGTTGFTCFASLQMPRRQRVGATRYRAPPAEGLVVVPLDEIVAIFHRASGITHLVAPPVPDLLDLMAGQWTTLDDVERAFELVDGDRAGLCAMLDELVVAGLVERA